jgi:glycosyltransferase involved in cell wall biosynthesis
VVATPSGGVTEQIQDGVTGLLARDISGSALAAALARALADGALRRRLGQAAEAADFSEEAFVERHRRLYTEVLKN